MPSSIFFLKIDFLGLLRLGEGIGEGIGDVPLRLPVEGSGGGLCRGLSTVWNKMNK